MAIKDNISDLNALILSGKAMDGFEKYYDENVSMQENENPPFVGKALNRKREQDFFASIEQFYGAEVKAVAIGENVSMVEWVMDLKIKGMSRTNMTQVAVQTWKNDKIISEKFYYDTGKK